MKTRAHNVGDQAVGATGRRRTVLGSESLIAGIGIAAAGILLLATASSAWWTARTHRASMEAASGDRASSVSQLLARGVEAHLSAGSLPGARVLMMETAAQQGLSACRLLLADGTVLVDTFARAGAASGLPEEWPGEVADGPVERAMTIDGGVAAGVTRIEVAGRGPAFLETSAPVRLPGWTAWEAQAGVAAGGVLGMVLLLGVYRVTRRRFGGIALVREALLAAADPVAATEELTMDERLGPEAVAWNGLVAERHALRESIADMKARESLSSGRRGSAELASACDALWQGMLLIDDQMRVRYANGAAAVLLRAKKEELIGGDASAVLGDESLASAVRGAASGATRQRVSMEIKRVDDGRPGSGGVLRFGVRQVRREDTASALVVIEDVTQQRAADEARNAFVAQATHELRTPLTNVRLYVEQLIDQPVDGSADDPKERARALNVINQEARRLERIVGDMLSVAEIEAGALKLRRGDVRMDVLLHDLEEEYRAQASEKGVSLMFDLPPKLPVISGDRDKVSLALHNLIGNGLKYTPAGGKVVVKVGESPSGVSVSVEDTGIGIKTEEHELVFDRFYRAKDSRIGSITGSGLGLALAREVARLHGGDITLRSELDKGSTFTFTVPKAA